MGIGGNSDNSSDLLSLPHIRYNPAITGIMGHGSKHRPGTRKRTRNTYSGSSVPLSRQSSAFFRSFTSTRSVFYVRYQSPYFKKTGYPRYALITILLPVVTFTGWGSDPVYDTSASTSTGPLVRFVPPVKTVYPSPPDAR